jgi:hypothetical protein
MSKFLSGIEQSVLDDLFEYRTIKKWKRDGNMVSQKGSKVAIPIGIHELKICKLEWKKAKNGEDMLHIYIKKPPFYINKENDRHEGRIVKKTISFDFINCYQFIAQDKRYDLNSRWFNTLGRFYTEEQLNTLFKFKNKPFKALVKHVEQEYQDHYFTRPEILKVYKNDEEINENIDYFKLYERIKK